MKFKKIGFPLLCFLIVYWVVAIFFIIISIAFGVALFFYLKSVNNFYFNWKKESLYAIRKAVTGGEILGAEIWFKAKLKEKKLTK
jgi:uncharacterized membrane protein (UPF0182 family)